MQTPCRKLNSETASGIKLQAIEFKSGTTVVRRWKVTD